MSRKNDFVPDVPRTVALANLYVKLSVEFLRLNAEGRLAGKKCWHPTKIHDDGLDLVMKFLAVSDSKRSGLPPDALVQIHDHILVSGISVITDMLDVLCYLAQTRKESRASVLSNLSPVLQEFNESAYNPLELNRFVAQTWTMVASLEDLPPWVEGAVTEERDSSN